jgi:hypothetical protein
MGRGAVVLGEQSVLTDVVVSPVLVEDQVLAFESPDLEWQHVLAQLLVRINRERAMQAARPHAVPLR